MADETLQNSHGSKESDGLNATAIIAKIVEVVLAVFAVGLIVDPLNSFQRIHYTPRLKVDDIAIIYISLAGYIIINMLFLIGYLIGDRIPKKTSILFSAVGAVLHVVAGSVIVHNWRHLNGTYISISSNAIIASKQYLDMLISASFFAFLNAIVFVIDIFLTFKFE
ncbi:uncharacterized protein LOC107271476 [Cephus cinctus]|uniref:Uncharacterized protein LOC107271476 n=1 Tax=Cephus cinctus TaxID=211228 RepID=A0AAJ7C6G5_CEPCN|nr:uncharacterized protein LOC107271476 [Cephus cinctus]